MDRQDPLYQAMNGMSVLPLYDRFKAAGITADDVRAALKAIGATTQGGAPGRQQALLESAAIKEKLVAAEGGDYPHNLWIRADNRGCTLAEAAGEDSEAQPAAPAASASTGQGGDSTGWARAFDRAYAVEQAPSEREQQAEAVAAVDSWDSAFAKAANN